MEYKDAETLEAIAEAREIVARLAPYFTFTNKEAPVSCTNIELIPIPDRMRGNSIWNWNDMHDALELLGKEGADWQHEGK